MVMDGYGYGYGYGYGTFLTSSSVDGRLPKRMSNLNVQCHYLYLSKKYFLFSL